ncbi:MAG TPA: MarR family transcriptional regulator [Ktedonobacterales bacterium]
MGRHRDSATVSEPVRVALETQHALTHAMQRIGISQWAHLDLSMGQLKALMTLASSDAMNVSELAERLAVSKPTASILVDRLVQLGYIERTEDSEDRRRTLATPTPKGSEIVARLQQGGSERLARWLELMDSADLEALTRGMRALATIIARDTGAPDDGAVALAGAGRQSKDKKEPKEGEE